MASARVSRWITVAAVFLLAGIAAVVSYSHMFELAQRHGEPEWRAALFPLSVDGMIIASSMTLLADARRGRRGGVLPWTLLILGSLASLAANVAVAEPTAWSAVIHAWPSFALAGAFELLMRELRREQGARSAHAFDEPGAPTALATEADEAPITVGQDGQAEQADDDRPRLHVVEAVEREADHPGASAIPYLQVEAWNWALEHRGKDGALPTGREIALHFNRKERWGRLIKQWGQQGRFGGVAA
ncbi:DUF2637 domain-containing protein [Nocardiopsis sp. RSe5-2]|uniref:DUF2637 domain-containing protein n=1 Tax=Nocardiopsis endophytica TaxID=3018445 RepID=A0ABT4TZ41_9ACTN|nr:DUF2637 domain-containing protein [Nocardiopsis endophytica]MDA2809947.1 DUF2637 domain-containing protein [Nocardiopsis endophytica]